MKLYYFNPNNYGAEYFVMSATKEDAIAAFNKHQIVLFEEVQKNDADTRRMRELEIGEEGYEPYDDTWDQKKVFKWGDFTFRNYTIDEYNQDEVLQSEIA